MEELACRDNRTVGADEWKEGPCLDVEAEEWTNPPEDQDESSSEFATVAQIE